MKCLFHVAGYKYHARGFNGKTGNRREIVMDERQHVVVSGKHFVTLPFNIKVIRMANSNQDIVNKYFEAYSKKDLEGVKKVMSESVTWYFLGHHPLAGIKKGIAEVLGFFDKVGKIMQESNPKIEKLIVAENSNYLVECIHSKTNRTDNNNLEHYACVLWTFENGKIIEGRHFFSDQQAIDNYFTAVTK